MGANLLKFRYLVQAAMTIVVLACGISIHAQVTTGTVRGVVTDQTGAVVPGASVTITDPNTKTSQTAENGGGG